MNTQSQKILSQAASNHRNSLLRSLERRIESARNRGDEQLLRQLEAEANYLHLK
jgi:hypothetical protein